MPDLKTTLQQIVSRAVDDAVTAYRQSLLASLGEGAPARRGAAGPSPTRGRRFVRRDPAAIARTVEAVHTFIEKNGGLTAEQIVKQMGGNKTEIADALARLRSSKRVKTKGAKRSTTYSA